MTRPRRVQFLYTGGTIGMVPSPRGLEPGGDVRAQIDAVLAAARAEPADTGDIEDIEVGFAEFERVIDSSNVTPEYWQQIIDHLNAHHDAFDGFVVLHGTNTLAHSAAAASFALTGWDKPVVFTGSQIPFGMPGSDAPGNVIGALRAAAAGRLTSVGLYFDGELLAGTRATKVSALSLNGFSSPNQAPLQPRPTPADTGFGSRAAAVTPPRGWDNPAPYRRHDVAVITVVPGLTAARFQAMTTPAPAAVILRAYGVGEGPSDEAGLEQAVHDLVDAGTPVIVMSQCLHTRIAMNKYAAGGFLARAGATGADDMTLEAAYAKVQFLLSQNMPTHQFGVWLRTDIAGELTHPDAPTADAATTPPPEPVHVP
jgi:L-asparaginase